MLAPAHPLVIQPDGSVLLVENEAVIRAHLAQIAGTQGSSRNGPQGELPWAPEFGGSVDHMRFAPIGSLLNEAVTARVVGSAAEWEPRARITSVQVKSDLATGEVDLTVTFGNNRGGRDQVVVKR